MARAHSGGWRSWTRGAVLPVEGTDFNDFETASDVGGLLALATKGGEMAELFGNFCRRNLTLESWDFIVAALHYEAKVSKLPLIGLPLKVAPWPDHQFSMLRQ